MAKDRRALEDKVLRAVDEGPVHPAGKHRWKNKELSQCSHWVYESITELDDKIDEYRKKVDRLYKDSDDRDAWSWAMRQVDEGMADAVSWTISMSRAIHRFARAFR